MRAPPLKSTVAVAPVAGRAVGCLRKSRRWIDDGRWTMVDWNCGEPSAPAKQLPSSAGGESRGDGHRHHGVTNHPCPSLPMRGITIMPSGELEDQAIVIRPSSIVNLSSAMREYLANASCAVDVGAEAVLSRSSSSRMRGPQLPVSMRQSLAGETPPSAPI